MNKLQRVPDPHLPPLLRVARQINEQRDLAPLIEAVLEERPQASEGIVPKDLVGEIEFRNVSFSYNGQPVLHDINLKIPGGSTLALVGRVGSGKSTLARFIPRLIHPDRGQVLIDGKPVESFSLAALRSLTDYVPQETFLFTDTLRENVALGGGGKNGAVERATEISGLTADLAQFPAGLERKVGERGIMLSGGQKQRLSVAVALVNDPVVLFLDEPTTGLDPQARRHMWELISSIRDDGATIVLTTHYMEEAEELCDRVAIMDAGNIVRLGSPVELVEELLATGFSKDWEVRPANLEDVFIHHTGHALREDS